MSMFLIGRHTRAEEESGRDELVRAGAVGRYAPLAAASLVAVTANVLFGVLIAASLIPYGLTVSGSVNLGLAGALSGLVFGAIALVAAQLTEGTRSMYGVTGAAIAAAYVLRAVGDVGNGALSWLSPIGWGQAMHSFSGDRWWPALVSVAAIGALVPVALVLFGRRDIGAGIWPARPGPEHAGPRLRGSLGLAWRLQRGSVVGWTGGLFLMGLAYGAIGDDVKDLLGDSDFSKEVFGQAGGSLVDSFYAIAALLLALVAGGFAISSALRPRGEEGGGRAETVLATALPRWRWAMSHLVVTVSGTVVVVASGGLGLGLGFALVTGDGSAVPRLFGATLPYVAPVLVLVGLTWLVYGLVPRVTIVGWLALTFCVLVMFLGETMHFPRWLKAVSPFTHLPLAPAESFAWAPVLWLLAAAAAVGAAGFAALRHRDLA
jgi:ABC-2 type transport system permease protein